MINLVMTRHYSYTTGGYYLYFKENRDALYNSDFATWTKNSDYDFVNEDKITYIDGLANLYSFYAGMDPVLNPSIWDILLSVGVAVAQTAVEYYILNSLGVQGTAAFISSIAATAVTTAISAILFPYFTQFNQNMFIEASNGYWYNDNGINRLILVSPVKLTHSVIPQLGSGTIPTTWDGGAMYGVVRTRGVFSEHGA